VVSHAQESRCFVKATANNTLLPPPKVRKRQKRSAEFKIYE
jgi:hypothetical protein